MDTPSGELLMAEAVIDIRDITRVYQMGENSFEALKGVDLTINEGEFVAIVGPSGSGKSTLMYILGCLDSPTQGKYCLNGREVSDLTDEELSAVRNDDIGYVFQHYNLLPELTVLENITLGLVYSGAAADQRVALARGYADRFGLSRHHGHLASELSGGQMQRVAIARALSGQPKLILADEPTGNLDSKTGEEIMSVLMQLHSLGHTIVMVTHDPTIAARAERSVKIVDGVIVDDTRNSDFITAKLSVSDERALQDARIDKKAGQGGVSYRDIMRMALQEGLLSKKTRTFLTMLGIIFGIAAVIAMNGITEGGKKKQLDQIRQVGLNSIQIHDADLEGARLLRARRLSPYGVTQTDLDAIILHAEGIESWTAWKTLKAELRYERLSIDEVSMIGILGDFQDVVNFYVDEGRFIQDVDQKRHARVCVVGFGIAEELAGDDESMIGKWITLGDEAFQVVGVMGYKEFSNSDIKDLQISDRNFDVYIPFESITNYFPKEQNASHFDTIALRMSTSETLLQDSMYIHKIVMKLHQDVDDFLVSVPLEKLKQEQQTKEVFNMIIIVIAAISLLVGGIGIMNIMLATVTERTREIGIRRTVGASQKDILHQFIAEALLISSIGGAIGLVVGVVSAELLELLTSFPVAFNPFVMVVAIVVSMGVGIVFGIYPAWMAARMDPVEALRS
jgi:macrolide transport system ATP-binding/permease protein